MRHKYYLLVTIQLLLIGAFLLLPAWPPVLHGSRLGLLAWQAGYWAQLVSGLLFVPGMYLVVSSVLALGGSFSILPQPRAGGRLVVSGAYRYLRHPIYTGLLLGLLGLALMAPYWIKLLLWAALVAFLPIKARIEEAQLARQYPAYQAYKARTGMFLPRIVRNKKKDPVV